MRSCAPTTSSMRSLPPPRAMLSRAPYPALAPQSALAAAPRRDKASVMSSSSPNLVAPHPTHTHTSAQGQSIAMGVHGQMSIASSQCTPYANHIKADENQNTLITNTKPDDLPPRPRLPPRPPPRPYRSYLSGFSSLSPRLRWRYNCQEAWKCQLLSPPPNIIFPLLHCHTIYTPLLCASSPATRR